MKLVIHIDGGSRGNPGPAGAGVVATDAQTKQPLHEAGYFLGRMTNNVAEYHGLLRALDLAQELGAEHVKIVSDSELLVRQVKGEYKVKSPELRRLWTRAIESLERIGAWEITHVLREFNHRADELVNLALDAGKDVVIPVRGQKAPDAPRPAPPTAVRFTVRFEAAPGAACPLPPAPGQSFVFGPGTPAGLCIHAAAAALGQEVTAHGRAYAPDGRAHCQRCGAVIETERLPPA